MRLPDYLEFNPTTACWQGAEIIFNSLAYNSVPLITAVVAKVVQLRLAQPLLTFALASTTVIIALGCYRRICHHFATSGNWQFENFVLKCYTLTQKYYHLRYIVALVALAIGHLWPKLGVVIALPLGLFYGVVVAIDVQRWRQHGVS